MADQHFVAQLQGFSLTTAEILYHLPDYPALLQTFLWQEYDMAPHFPKLLAFLKFWDKHLDGKLHGVRVASKRLIDSVELRVCDGRFVLQ